MSILDRILKLLEEKHIPDSVLCLNIGVSTGTFGTWKSRKTEPPAKYIVPIADYLGVPTRYLLVGEYDTEPITTEERRLLTAFRNFNAMGKDVCLNFIETMCKQPDLDKEKNSFMDSKVG